MDCRIARQKLFDRLDCEIDADAGETSSSSSPGKTSGCAVGGVNDDLEKHLAACASCRREYRLLLFARAASASEPPVTASPWFYQRLRRRIEGDARDSAGGPAVWKLARRTIPALAGITLTLALVFTWQEARHSDAAQAMPQNYEHVFMTDDAAWRMLTADQDAITYESILAALTERYGSAD